MSNTFYFSQSTGIVASPSFSTYWTATTSVDRKVLSSSKTETGVPSVKEIYKNFPNTGVFNFLNRQYVAQLNMGTAAINGLFRGQIQGREDSTAGDYKTSLTISIHSPSGSLKQTVFSGAVGSEYENTSYGILQNRTFSGNCAYFEFDNYDLLVVEVGLYRLTNSGNSGAAYRGGFQKFGSKSTYANLPVNNTETGNSYVPWITFDGIAQL